MSPAPLWAADTTPPAAPAVTDQGASVAWSEPYALIFTIAGADPESSVAFFGYNLRQGSPTGPVLNSAFSVYSPALQSQGWVQLSIPSDIVAAGSTYYLEARVQNGAGLWSTFGYSDGIQVVAAAPFDFGLTHNPPASEDITLLPGQSGTTRVELWHLNGREPVTFSVSNLPAGAAASISPQVCAPNCAPVITVTTAASTPVGTHTVRVTGTGAGVTRQVDFLLRVGVPPPPFDFGLTHNPPASEDITLNAGQSGTTRVELWHLSGREPVTFSVSNLPAGAAASISPQVCAPNCTPVITVTTAASTPVGTHTVRVTGTGAGVTRQVDFLLRVGVPPPPFDFGLTHNRPRTDILLTPGQTGVTAVDLWHLSGSPVVSFSASGLPAGAIATISPNACTPNCSPTVTVSTQPTTPSGVFTITVTGTGGGVTRQTTLRLKVETTPPGAPGRATEGSPDQDFDADGAYTVFWPAASDPESGISAYELQEFSSATNAFAILSSTLTGTSFPVSGRPNGQLFRYRVRAKNGLGVWGAFSPDSDGITVDTTSPTAPGQPSEGSPDQDLDKDGAYTISWAVASDTGSGVSAYELQERVGTAGTWQTLSSTITTSAFPVTGRLDNTTYFYQVRAKNGAGLLGAYSPVSDGIRIDAQAPQLSLIGVTEITTTSAKVAWTTNETASAAVDYGTTTSYGQTATTSTLGTSHAITLSGLTAGTLYHFRARSADAAGNAAQSSDQTFQTAGGALGPSVVTTSGRQLLLRRRNPDGTLGPALPYTIRGVAWSPASKTTATSPADANNANVRRPEFGRWYLTDLPLMKAMNVNTIRTFIDFGFDATLGPVGRQILDECYRNGIMVVMTVDDAINNTARAQQVVNYYKDHPAILAWSLGNEWNINAYYGVASSIADAAQRTQNAAALIKTLDPNHPVVSSYGEFDLYSSTGMANLSTFVNTTCPSVDVWSFNLYRGDSFGPLYMQWASISTKPMFIAEFGADAFHVDAPANPPTGVLNETLQSQWILSLWNDVARNLSAKDPNKTALGATVFEWNDEWWKVSPWGQQDQGGWFSEGFPDGMGNEEYFGMVTIDRVTRQVYGALKTAFNPTYVPPAPSKTPIFRAYSTGATVPATNWAHGIAKFYKDKALTYAKYGGAGGGRGFNVLAIQPTTGEPVQLHKNFDTWVTRGNCDPATSAMVALTNFLNSLPNGTLILIAVGDEAGLTQSHLQPCVRIPATCIDQGIATLQALGSAQIQNYCYWDSWAMVTVKGEVGTDGRPKARQEQLGKAVIGNGVDASVQATLTLP
jgi:hypothetical protein